MLVGWELVGVCSFALIGHWWEEKPNTDAALKAFLTNRVGDVGLHHRRDRHCSSPPARQFNVAPDQPDGAVEPAAQPPRCCSSARCCLIGGVTSKSGQFPLHTWLPDAMAGPTPVSALIHAATMVVAGVYLIARLYACSSRASTIGDGSTINSLARHRRRHRARRRARWPSCRTTSRRCWPTRRSASSATWCMALGVGAWTGGHLPPLHPRLLQGLPVPRRRLGEPRRTTPST